MSNPRHTQQAHVRALRDVSDDNKFVGMTVRLHSCRGEERRLMSPAGTCARVGSDGPLPCRTGVPRIDKVVHPPLASRCTGHHRQLTIPLPAKRSPALYQSHSFGYSGSSFTTLPRKCELLIRRACTILTSRCLSAELPDPFFPQCRLRRATRP